MTKFIGEIGVNHLGEKDLAFKMVKKLASSGVDAISMQVLDKKDYDNKKPWRRRKFDWRLSMCCSFLCYLEPRLRMDCHYLC